MPQNIQTEALVIIALFPSLSTVFIILRSCSRWLSRAIGWDDALLLLAYLLAVGEAATSWLFTKLSWQGYHIWDIPPQSIDEQINAEKVDLANQLLYNPILALVRASLILFLFRLGDTRRIVRWNLIAIFWVNLGLLISIFLADLLQCSPLHYAYDAPAMDLAAQQETGDDSAKGGSCIHEVQFFLASASLSIVTDIWLLCIPSVIVRRLQMSRRKKMAVIAVLSMGAIVTLVAIARLVIYAYRFQPDRDSTYNIGHTMSSIEVNVAIMTASATSFPVLFKRIAPRSWSTDQRPSSNNRTPDWSLPTTFKRGMYCGQRQESYEMMDDAKAESATSRERIIPRDGPSSTRSDLALDSL
ncbi:hypothetical protein BDV18DRAFT_148297 [Aspergillus unguis]